MNVPSPTCSVTSRNVTPFFFSFAMSGFVRWNPAVGAATALAVFFVPESPVRSPGRVDWVDYAKGFCIIMVVMMHSTLGVEAAAGETGWMHHVVEFARPFRMPDFFLISGLFLVSGLGKIAGWDAMFYIVAQFLGGLAGVLTARAWLGARVEGLERRVEADLVDHAADRLAHRAEVRGVEAALGDEQAVPVDIVTVVQSLIVLFIAAPPLVRAIFRIKESKKAVAA